MFTLGKVLISTRGLALGNYHFYMNAKPSVAMVQGEMCQCPLGLIPHFYMVSTTDTKGSVCHVSMPSRAYTSFLRPTATKGEIEAMACQCPLGLIPHFYSEKTMDRRFCRNGVNALSGLYLISTAVNPAATKMDVQEVSMPSRAYTSFLLTECAPAECAFYCVSMPSRAYTSFLRSPFKNLDFMRFPEPVFAGIYQNILTTAVFHAC